MQLDKYCSETARHDIYIIFNKWKTKIYLENRFIKIAAWPTLVILLYWDFNKLIERNGVWHNFDDMLYVTLQYIVLSIHVRTSHIQELSMSWTVNPRSLFIKSVFLYSLGVDLAFSTHLAIQVSDKAYRPINWAPRSFIDGLIFPVETFPQKVDSGPTDR